MKSSFHIILAVLGAFALNTGASLASNCGEGHDMHAKILGVDPARFSESDLVEIEVAKAEGDEQTVTWIKERGYRADVSKANTGYCEMSYVSR
jgi:hypothetical protein